MFGDSTMMTGSSRPTSSSKSLAPETIQAKDMLIVLVFQASVMPPPAYSVLIVAEAKQSLYDIRNAIEIWCSYLAVVNIVWG